MGWRSFYVPWGAPVICRRQSLEQLVGVLKKRFELHSPTSRDGVSTDLGVPIDTRPNSIGCKSSYSTHTNNPIMKE